MLRRRDLCESRHEELVHHVGPRTAGPDGVVGVGYLTLPTLGGVPWGGSKGSHEVVGIPWGGWDSLMR